MHKSLAFMLLLTITTTPAWAQQGHVTPSPATAASTATVLHLSKAKVIYHDAHGKLISKAAFAKAMQAGHAFSMVPSADHKGFVMSLLPKGAKPAATGFQSKPEVTLGKPLPAFDLPTLAGSQASPATLAGATTLVDLFFADCRACIEELPTLNAFKAKHPHMHYLAITFDGARTAKGFVEKHHFNWPVAYAGNQYLSKRLKNRVYPTLLLLDAKGNVLAMRIGLRTTEVLPPTMSGKVGKTTRPAASADSLKRQVQAMEQWVSKHEAAHQVRM